MNILFIVPSYKPAYIYGGPIVVIAQLAETLVKMGHQVTVYTTTANGSEELNVEPNQVKNVDGVQVYYFKRITKDHTHISTALWKHLNKNVKSFDVVHIHSWWNFLVMGAVWVCAKNGITPILSPHGMLSTYILETNNSFSKNMLHKLIGRRLLAKTRLHVSTEMELNESRNIIPEWKGDVIPNPVILSQKNYIRSGNPKFTIGFLSRIDPKKGLDVLIRALSKVDFDFELRVAGAGEKDYEESLKLLAKELGIGDKISWLGWKKGEEKFDYLAGLDLFALTSHSENFAIVVIESLSVGTPVFISNQVGLHTFVTQKDYGWVCTMDVEDITKQLNTVVSEKEKLKRINQYAGNEIQLEYNDENLALRYLEFYKAQKN